MTYLVRTLVLAAVTAAASPALAHAHLKSATPAVGGTVKTSPPELDLGFSEGVNPAFTGVKLTGPAGIDIPTGAAKLGAGGATSLVVPLAGPLAPGAYTVDWHALAVDGHKTEGTYGFTVAP